jgi:hypothetical protein
MGKRKVAGFLTLRMLTIFDVGYESAYDLSRSCIHPDFPIVPVGVKAFLRIKPVQFSDEIGT